MSWESIDSFGGFQEEENQCSAGQMAMIESLLVIANIDQKEKDLISSQIESYSEQEATETINYLNENKVENNLMEIWKRQIKRY